MKGKIYTLKDPITNEIKYCGQTTKSLKVRLNDHIQDSKRRFYPNALWVKSLREKNLLPVIELLEECEIVDLYSKEINYIKELSLIHNLTNIQKGGKDGSFIKFDEKAKNKISNFMKNYKKSQDHIDKMKLALSKTVYQYNTNGDFINEYRLNKQQFTELGFDKNKISSACRREGTSHGYVWRYFKIDKLKSQIPYYKK